MALPIFKDMKKLVRAFSRQAHHPLPESRPVSLLFERPGDFRGLAPVRRLAGSVLAHERRLIPPRSRPPHKFFSALAGRQPRRVSTTEETSWGEPISTRTGPSRGRGSDPEPRPRSLRETGAYRAHKDRRVVRLSKRGDPIQKAGKGPPKLGWRTFSNTILALYPGEGGARF